MAFMPTLMGNLITWGFIASQNGPKALAARMTVPRSAPPPSIWSRVVKFGSGWGFWVSSTVFITTTHVIPPGAKEIFGENISNIAIHRVGEFTQFRFSKKMRPDLSGMVLEEGCPEGTVCTIMIKRDSGELLPLAVRMGAVASMKIQGKLMHGQSGMLLTGANAKGMDLGTIPGDCGAPYIHKRGVA